MISNEYSFAELAAKAKANPENQEALENLADWFRDYDTADWNGECWKVDSTTYLYPIYTEIAEDEYEIARYELR